MSLSLFHFFPNFFHFSLMLISPIIAQCPPTWYSHYGCLFFAPPHYSCINSAMFVRTSDPVCFSLTGHREAKTRQNKQQSIRTTEIGASCFWKTGRRYFRLINYLLGEFNVTSQKTREIAGRQKGCLVSYTYSEESSPTCALSSITFYLLNVVL